MAESAVSITQCQYTGKINSHEIVFFRQKIG